MTRREKVLAGTVGLMAVLWFGSSALTRYRDAVDDNQAKLRSAEQKLSQARTAKLRAQRAVTKLKRWQKQSLPTNPDIANSLYQDWLQKQLTEAGLKVTDIKSSLGLRAPNDRFQEFNFKIEASGQMAQFVDFLARFYKAGHLQRISRASLVPAKEGNDLTISLMVDALAMRDASRADSLPDGVSNGELPDLKNLQETIVKRDLFSPYKDPKAAAVASKPVPTANEAEQAFISGMTQGAEGWQMSVRMKDSGKMLYFRTGDSIAIGGFSAKIIEIGDRRVIVERDGSQLQVFLGQNLNQAQPFKPQAS
jgi:hypothetical protein